MDKRMNIRLNYKGFTLVELLIVIVVIAILAAISIVAYNGIQDRSRDSQRKSDTAAIIKALEMYRVDNGGYPTCSGTTYQPGDVRSSCYSDNAAFIAALAPKYISEVPRDPIGTGDFRYRYVFGSRKATDVAYSGDSSDNYVLGVSYETKDGPYVTAWGTETRYNYIFGSSN